MGEVLTPKKQAIVDRLRRRIENYRRRQTDFMPRFDQTFNGFCEQNIQETLLLKQKFLENKAKRTAKKQDKKQTEPGSNIQNNLLTQQKFLKRTAEDLEAPEYGDSAPKIQCGAGGGGGGGTASTPPSGGAGTGGGGTTRTTESLTKFSVEIVQQLEFTTSAANSQPQQISTNVTVKALTNASVKSDVGNMNSPKSGPDTPNNPNPQTQTGGRTSSANIDLGNLVECKQEPDSEFVDLEQCAAALEKDAQNNGASFPGFSEFIGDEGGDEIITSDAFKVLISEISDFNPEFMKDFDFDEQKPNFNLSANSDNQSGSHNISISATGQMKVESDSKDNVQLHPNMMDVGKSPPNSQYPPGQYDPNALGKARMGHYAGLEFGKAELSPAAQTLKQMAEQHQHKTQLGMNYTGNRNPRSPYGDYQLGSNNEYINSPSSTNTPPGSGQFINKNIPPNTQNFSNQNQSTNTGNGPSLPEVKQEVMFSATQTQNFQTGTNMDMQKRMQVIQQQQQQQMTSQAQSPQAPKTPTNPTMMGGYKQQYSPYGSPGGHGSPGYIPRGQGPGAPFGGPASTPPRPPSVSGGAPTLQMSQAQQMQVNQQNSGQQIQVSAGQHLQLSGDLKSSVSVAAQQQGAFFNQQSDSFSVSQSQTINFTQQNLRGRGPGTGPRPEPQLKLMQQASCVLRAQQQPMGIRPPPPEYKSSQPQMIHSLPPQRFPATALRRAGPGQQPMPPSGPMMRPQHAAGGTVYMGGAGMPRGPPMGYSLGPRQRPPNVSVGPDGMPIGNRNNAEWKHILMSQQQSVGFTHVRPFNTHQVPNNPAGVQMHSQIRGQLPPGGQMQMLPQDQLLMQGQPTNSNQLSMNLQMSQSQSMTLGSGMNPHHQLHNMTSGVNPHMHQYSSSSGFTNTTNNTFVNSSGTPVTSVSQSNNSNNNNNNNSNSNNNNNNISNNNNNSNNNLATNDFGFEFLESLPGDPPFSAQDLLSSLVSTSNFNLNDIL